MIKNIPYLNTEDLPRVPFVINGISSRFIRENKLIPLEMKNNVLKVVMADPEDAATIDALRVATSADVAVYACDSKALEDCLSRFYDQETQNINRKEIWSERIPSTGNATPMSYRVRDGGRQFVVIAAGGHSQMRSRRGDSLIAFALPE